MFSSIADAVGGVVGGVLGYKGTKKTNQANERIASARNVFEQEEAEKARLFSQGEAKTNREFQADQIANQMGFQERMSSTAVSRRMADMKKAGINPILAGKYDASSPAGGAGSGGIGATAKANSQGYTAQNQMQGFLDNVGSALDLKFKQKQIDNVQAQTGKTHMETNLISTGLPKKSLFERGWKGLTSGIDSIGPNMLKFSDWAQQVQTEAKQGKYINAINRWLDKADKYLESGVKATSKKWGVSSPWTNSYKGN